MNNFTQRTLSGTVYVAVVVSSILVHPIYFGVVFAIISMLAVREYMKLMHTHTLQIGLGMFSSLLLFAGAWIACQQVLSPTAAVWIGLIYCLSLIVGLILELFLKNEHPIQQWGYVLQAQGMIALPFALMNPIMMQGKYWLLALFITIWVNDSGAYVVGSLLAKRPQGNHKMFPRVSPAKSWEGLLGGMLFALACGYIYMCAGWIESLSSALLFTFLISVFGTLGDLMESLMKRSIGIKDSGNFMPGHGGVLDRFDSILLSTPIVAIFLLVTQLL